MTKRIVLALVAMFCLAESVAIAGTLASGSTACGVNGSTGPTKIAANQGLRDIVITNTSTTPAFIGGSTVTPATAPCISAAGHCGGTVFSENGITNARDLYCVGNAAVTVFWVGQTL